MSCNTPVLIKVPGAGYQYTACGYCQGCRITRLSHLEFRIRQEQRKNLFAGFGSAFVTYTYDDEHLPQNGCVKKDMQDFHKRLRENLRRDKVNYNSKFKYFMVSEYGSETFRPHYHGIYLGIDFSLESYFRKNWPFGFINCGPVMPGGIRYVIKYLEKCRPRKDEKEIYLQFGINPPFTLYSKGLGLDWFIQNQFDIQKKGGYYNKGRLIVPPPYIRRKLGIVIKPDIIREKQNKANAQKLGISRERYEQQQKILREQSLIARARMHGDILESLI